jgi:hypothetical protein
MKNKQYHKVREIFFLIQSFFYFLGKFCMFTTVTYECFIHSARLRDFKLKCSDLDSLFFYPYFVIKRLLFRYHYYLFFK